MAVDPLVDTARDLYALPPDEFVAARDEAVKQARASGDRQLAAAIAKLRRPTVGAWVLNRLARERPDLLDELVELGEALRSAQRDLRGEELRELTMQRRSVVSRLTREAARLAQRGYGRGDLPLSEIEATLTAALADPDVADQVRAGLLAKPVAYAGFGETPRPRLRLVQGGGADPDADAGADRDGGGGGRAARDAGGGPAKRSLHAAGTATDSADDLRTGAGSATRVPPSRPTPIREGAAKRAEREAAKQARREAAEREAAEREAAERASREAGEQAEREAAERAEQKAAEVARRDAERASAARLKKARAAAHRELLAARTELAEAEAVRVEAERAVKAAKRRVEKAAAAVHNLDIETLT
jgi:hypothetical protein